METYTYKRYGTHTVSTHEEVTQYDITTTVLRWWSHYSKNDGGGDGDVTECEVAATIFTVLKRKWLNLFLATLVLRLALPSSNTGILFASYPKLLFPSEVCV